MTDKTVGLDLAKDVFQVHGVSETGHKVFNKKIKRETFYSVIRN
jgi:transposase